MQQPTAEELNRYILEDEQVSTADDWMNTERFEFICEAFDMEDVDLFDHYPFEKAEASDDPTLVEATYHLCRMQRHLVIAFHQLEYITKEQFDTRSAHFEIWNFKLSWRCLHLNEGGSVPPYPFLH